MGRILGIDFGIKKCGIAVTDPDHIIVSPLKTVKTSSLLSFIEVYQREEEIEKIVFGYPVHPDGEPTYLWGNIQSFVKQLKEVLPNVAVDFQDERFTSREAQQIILQSGLSKKQRQDKSRLDKISAVLILQRYLKHI